MEKYTDYRVISVKMPWELKERIDVLAKKSSTTRNGWIVRTLASQARWGKGKRK